LDRKFLEKHYKKANNQLFHIDCRKTKVKKEIYSLYDLYLKIIRSKLENYIGEAITALVDISSDKTNLKDKRTILFIKNDLKKLVKKTLPFLTIEQLSIKKEYRIDNQIKNKIEFEYSYNLKEEVYRTKDFEKIYSNNLTNYCSIYYDNLIDHNEFININIDSSMLENKTFDYKNDYLKFINSAILLNENDNGKLCININQSKNSKYFVPIEFKDILIWLDTLESSLNLYLKDLSIAINNELLNKNIIKTYVSNDLTLYILENHLLFSNPSPFILEFDPSLNQYINFDEIHTKNKLSKLNLINIDSAELEFINIKLSMLKNKLLEIKSNIYLLIKKENYWFNKLKHNSNIKPIINKV